MAVAKVVQVLRARLASGTLSIGLRVRQGDVMAGVADAGDTAPAVARSDVVIPVGEGRLAAWLYGVASDSPTPCVVMAHGFTGVRDMQLDAPARAFAAAGYRVLVFDYRHFGDSSGEPRQLVDLKRQYADWDAAIAFARNTDGVDAGRIVLWGTSFAGGHVLDAATRADGVAAVISQAPFVDGRAVALSLLRHYPRVVLRVQMTALADQLGAALGRPPRYVAVTAPRGGRALLPAPHVWESVPTVVPAGSTWRNEVAARVALRIGLHRPLTRVRNITCPVLLQVLDDETVLPVRPVHRAAQQLGSAELLTYRGLDHFDVYVGDGFRRLLSDQLEFLARTVPPAVEADRDRDRQRQ